MFGNTVNWAGMAAVESGIVCEAAVRLRMSDLRAGSGERLVLWPPNRGVCGPADPDLTAGELAVCCPAAYLERLVPRHNLMRSR